MQTISSTTITRESFDRQLWAPDWSRRERMRRMTARLGTSALAVFGSLLVLCALAIIWNARATVERNLYVSELGAVGEPTARVFEVALLLVVAGGSAVAFASRDVRSYPRILNAWRPAVSLWIASGFFLVASQVTCTQGCPVPYGAQFTWQDFTHILCAVVAFGAACWAMLQVSFARDQLLMALFSRVCGVAVLGIAATGGILSLIGVALGFGSWLEFVATTIAIGWLAVYGAVVAYRAVRGESPQQLTRNDVEQSVR
jgi:hypothetical protein